jgi:hypothetical protein
MSLNPCPVPPRASRCAGLRLPCFAFCLLPLTALCLCVSAVSQSPAGAQALPRLTALYPPGARAGTTVEVSIRGGGLEGAREVLVHGDGISAKLNDAGVKVDPADQKVFQAKCALCHELRGPSTISRTAEQWVATVDRMIRDRSAPIETADRTKIVNYVTAAARASAGLTAQVTVAKDAAPGRREVRVVGANGTSTVFPFEVTQEPEALEVEPNNVPDKPQAVSAPVVVSGQIAQGDVDCYAVQAKKGERIVFNCSAYRLNEASQAFFYPVLYLYDEKGRELRKNIGYFGLDPLIDWTAPEDARYTVAVRDMLYRGSPGSVYRLTIGALPYRTYLFPPGGMRGANADVTVFGENAEPRNVLLSLPAGREPGVIPAETPLGPVPFYVDSFPSVIERTGEAPQPVTLPAGINGRIEKAAEVDRYVFTVTKEQLGGYAFDLYADQVGSTLAGRLTLKNARGQALATAAATSDSRDPRLAYTFTQAGEYTVEVTDARDRGSAAQVYHLRAGPAAPDFELAVGPDNPNLGPGSSVYLTVRATRRVSVPGEIQVTFPNLPPGVTASPTVIAPGENQAFVILSAAPDARPGSVAVTEVLGKAVVDGREITRRATPYEIYRINNNPQPVPRSAMVVSVGPATGWTAALEPSAVEMISGGAPVMVKVRVERRGADADIPFAIVGVPNGVQGPRSVLMKRGTSEMTFTLTPTNGGVFARGATPPPRFLLAVVNGREGEGMMMASPAIQLAIGSGSR